MLLSFPAVCLAAAALLLLLWMDVRSRRLMGSETDDESSGLGFSGWTIVAGMLWVLFIQEQVMAWLLWLRATNNRASTSIYGPLWLRVLVDILALGMLVAWLGWRSDGRWMQLFRVPKLFQSTAAIVTGLAAWWLFHEAVLAGLLWWDPRMFEGEEVYPLFDERFGVQLWIGVVSAAIPEEVIFRGLLFPKLQRFGPTSAVLLSSACFAVAHLDGSVVNLASLFLGGMVLAVTFAWSRTLWVPILLHLMWNLMAIL